MEMKIKNSSARGIISEQAIYTPKTEGYPNYSNMNRLSEIPQIRGEEHALRNIRNGC